MEMDEKIQAHVLSIWKENRGFFSGKGSEGMLILTNKRLLFIKKTEAPMKWWGAIRTRQIVRLLQFKDVMVTEDGYDVTNLEIDLEIEHAPARAMGLANYISRKLLKR